MMLSIKLLKKLRLEFVLHRCYLIWRRHHVLPEDDDEHPFLGIMILAIEIILGEAYTKQSKKKAGTEDFAT